jgi:KDO2-lipid IV(A) lauroyltransferase
MTRDPFSALAALRILRDGGVVAVQGDRDFDNTGIAVPFFGRPAFFPRGPAFLSLLSRAPILPVFIVRAERADGGDSGGFRVIFFDPIEPEGDARSAEAVQRMLRRSVAAIESIVREYPDQWYCFYPFWDDPTRAEAPTAEA